MRAALGICADVDVGRNDEQARLGDGLVSFLFHCSLFVFVFCVVR